MIIEEDGLYARKDKGGKLTFFVELPDVDLVRLTQEDLIDAIGYVPKRQDLTLKSVGFGFYKVRIDVIRRQTKDEI